MNTGVSQRWGFGMAPIKPKMQAKRLCYVENLKKVIATNKSLPEDAESFSEVKGLFTRIYKQDQWDWFTVFEQLGCPGRKKCREISGELSHARKIIVGKSDGDISKKCELLRNNGIEKHLDLFLNPRPEAEKSEKIYILSTREQRDFLKIGFTTRSVRERTHEINSATGIAIPFGVRAVWSVKDASRMERIIHEKLSPFRIRKDREFFAMDYGEAFRSINRILREERVKAIEEVLTARSRGQQSLSYALRGLPLLLRMPLARKNSVLGLHQNIGNRP